MSKKPKGNEVGSDGQTARGGEDVTGLAVWIRSGVYGELSAVRKSAATHPDSDMESLAESIAHAIVGADGGTAGVGTVINDVVPPDMRGDVDVRFFIMPELPAPSMLLGQLVAVYQWPALMFAPTAIRAGAAYLTDVDGSHVIVVAAKRHVVPRVRKAA